ncbi:hypothetical protein K4K49_000441 [Colletotrichum sp. SAR 10_70]|nr:hypothetical protein K4K50_013246 [Colletotrichum sp. SAR 10_71]KAI8185134.1 hypothetical protein K4K49_000441 [Colletotrichum sp. SAR 10_70]KAI8215064.1 hypothetical protein K4K52_010797 [Colletotrichum sp. SAR 10_76]KAI8235307.1 hypothetical protein K4K54_006525 [Colletotrichum sp. SAR 10_86]KAI8248324.1 hypothetical protein K4K53_000987 [Colletotrichum sp. SAR 10_77]KAI8256375.1 hypothetical protein K4K58_004896 [Colletotrichum sp. SAR11_239]KAJ5008309.1 hypothetical protein K4K48_00373
MKLRFEGWDTRLTTMISSISHVLKWKLFHHKELSEWTKLRCLETHAILLYLIKLKVPLWLLKMALS